MRIEATHECDDGNVEDGDGCDSTCHIEPKYLCEGGGPSSRDICTPIITLSIVGFTISDDFLITVTFNEKVHFNGMWYFTLLEFKLDNLSFDMDDSLNLDIQF